MKHKKSRILILLCIAIACLYCSACAKTTFAKPADSNEPFVCIKAQTVNDGSLNGIDTYVFVHKKTRVMYMCVSQYRSGYGTGLSVMLDVDGKPLLYEGEF